MEENFILFFDDNAYLRVYVSIKLEGLRYYHIFFIGDNVQSLIGMAS